MQQVLHVLFGAGFTVAVACAMGALLLHVLSVKLQKWETALFAFVSGSACLSLAVFLLCAVGQAKKGWFLWGGVAVMVVWGIVNRPFPRGRLSVPNVPTAAILLTFFGVYFLTALAPERSPDGSGYHLGNVVRIWQHHGFVWDYHSMYAYLSQGLEMLFLVAFSFGGHSAAAIVHLAFQTALPLLIVSYGRRFGFPRAGLFAAVLVYAAPVVGLDGASAYNDLAVATQTYAVFYLLQVWDETREHNLLILIGLLAGFSYALKYTGFLALPFAAGFVWWRSRQWRQVSVVALAAAILIAPWVLRNWIWLGNPVAPFFNAWFPNPYYHAGEEAVYLQTLRHYSDIKHYWQIPLQLTLQGGVVGGLIGPAFLLAPFALLDRQGRRLLLGAAIFAIPAFLNTGARFLIPSLPFVALAMGIGLGSSRGVLPAVALFQAIACWPAVVNLYCDKWAWRISTVPIRAALRREPEAEYIQAMVGDYAWKGPVEQMVAAGEKVFSFAGRPEAYINRHIVVGYESTLGNLVQDTLWAPMAHKPARRQRFRFLPLSGRAVRVVETAAADASWTVAEMRVFSQGRELSRSHEWRLSARPNGWDVGLAFDNNYATRWSTWQPMRPRDFVEIDFGREETFDEVLLECAHVFESHVQVEVLTADGRWVPITDTSEESDADPPPGIRLAAVQVLRAHGIRYLLINTGDFVAEDMQKYAKFWGITLLAEANGTRFYRID